ncbi:protein HEAT-INDUCED TAS1 TARGET 4 [Eutrema salsugineum]|uniref:protein HEAT-INDUCED TAS1 TARGET 4 n=1 Tax=Eutrema salsugineum TaxID=72664 RepID=UPI000CED6A15|nr:protein HEAT-INDUCED TAS1 TARGET 4 [Eutrema salsugineum]
MEEEEVVAEEILDLPVEIISQILETNPTSSIKFIKIKHAIYAYWRVFRNVQDSLKGTNWKEEMGRVRNQGLCSDTCWAVVAAELVSALLFIKKINKTYIEYSAQDILDFADPEKARNCNRHDHYCYTLSIRKGLHYVLREGLQKEEHRPYKRCRHASEIPARIPRDLAHIDGVEMLSFDEALIKLETQPIGASLHIFMPDYKLVKKLYL